MYILDEAGNGLSDEAGNPLLDESATPFSGLSLVKITPPTLMAEPPSDTGPWSQAIGNTAGNALLAFAAWNTSPQAGYAGIVPASSVADSTGNWWRLAGDSGAACPAARCAAWVCDSALAVPDTGWWSFALQGYVGAAVWTVAEFSGAPAGWEPAVDFAVSSNTGASGTGTAVTLAGVTSQADWCFAVACGAGSAVTITGPGGSWATVASGGDGGLGEFISASCAWQAAGSAASVSATFGLGTASPAAGVLIALSQASYPPAQQNPNFPAVRVEAALGADGGSPSQALPESAWTDLTPRAIAKQGVAGITATRGREYELAEPEAGVLDVLLNNVDGAFDPQWPGSPYYSNAVNQNMSFQLSTAPWNVHGGSMGLSAAYAYASGAGATAAVSLRLVPDGASAFPGITGDTFAVNPNSLYSMSAWVLCPAGWTTGAFTDVFWYDSSLGFISAQAGPVTAVPAGTGAWTYLSLAGITPPTGAAFAYLAVYMQGTPPSSAVMYIAEAAIAESPALPQTGLVALGTPVRVSAWWENRRYPVGYGYVERWPQDWPDMPQWGFSPLTATDAAGAAASANIPSAVQGEILADGPYVCLPFNDQYTSSTNTTDGPQLSSISASGLIAVNTSRVNQQSAVYYGGTGGIATGQSLSFLGDSGTGMGVSSLGSVDTQNFRGSGAVYGPDPGLPFLSSTSGASIECWVSMPTVANGGSQYLFQMLQLFGPPWIGSTGADAQAPGWVAAAGVALPATSGSPGLFVSQSTFAGPQVDPSALVPFAGLNHIALTVAPGGATDLYLNGALAFGIGEADMLQGPLTAVTFGQAPYSYGQDWPLWNYSLAYGTVYAYALPQARVLSHYVSGADGFAGFDSFAVRAGRYLAWGNVGLNPAGPGGVPDPMLLSAAYDTDGSSLASALNADAQSSGGQWRASAGGNLVIVPRPAFYGLPSTVTFGDDPSLGEIPYTVGDLDYDNTYLKNVVQATLEQGPNTLIAPVEKNLPSEAQYGARGPLALTVSGSSAQDAYDAAYWNLNKYAQPQMRVREITVDAAGYPAALAAVLSTDIGAVCTVNRRPLGGPPYSLPVTAEQVSHQIGPGVWKTTYQLSPYVQEASVLQADVPGQDVLGAGPLAW